MRPHFRSPQSFQVMSYVAAGEVVSVIDCVVDGDESVVVSLPVDVPPHDDSTASVDNTTSEEARRRERVARDDITVTLGVLCHIAP